MAIERVRSESWLVDIIHHLLSRDLLIEKIPNCCLLHNNGIANMTQPTDKWL